MSDLCLQVIERVINKYKDLDVDLDVKRKRVHSQFWHSRRGHDFCKRGMQAWDAACCN